MLMTHDELKSILISLCFLLFAGPGEESLDVCGPGGGGSAKGENCWANGTNNSSRTREHNSENKCNPGNTGTVT